MNEMNCERCGRRRHRPDSPWDRCEGPPTYVTVEHGYYGCDTGCCGNRVVVYHESGAEFEDTFEFSHEREEMFEMARATAQRLGVPFKEEESRFSDID